MINSTHAFKDDPRNQAIPAVMSRPLIHTTTR